MDRKKKERVNLRKRLMPSGNTSLYLDVFTKEGTKNEHLKLYIMLSISISADAVSLFSIALRKSSNTFPLYEKYFAP